MKRYVVLLMLVAVLFFAGCDTIYDNLEDVGNSTDYCESTYSGHEFSIATGSILEGELPNYDISNLEKWKVNINDGVWRINKLRYYEQCTEYEKLSMRSEWKIDLTKFKPSGIGKNSMVFFTPLIGSNSNILIAKSNENLFLLVVYGDEVDPLSYEVNDFQIESEENTISPDLLQKLWDKHVVTKEEDVKHILDLFPTVVRLRLIKNPELVYEFDYLYYCGEYYTSAPVSISMDIGL